MAREWTKEQQAAIDERDKTLLVSAAAGSGKTATLTERIIRTLTDPAGRGDISRMLVVTFTRSAAAELRNRLSRALRDAMAEGKGVRHLSRQLMLLPGARISTIDSFAAELVRKNAVRLGLSPAFRTADPPEALLLRHSVMNRLIEDCYEGYDDGDIGISGDEFSALVDCLTGTRGDRKLGDLLLSLYQSTQGFVGREQQILCMAGKMREDAEKNLPPEETLWGTYLLATLQSEGEGWQARLRHVAARAAADEGAAAYLPVLDEDREDLAALLAAIPRGYAAAREALGAFRKSRLPALRGEKKTPVAEEVAAERTQFFEKFRRPWLEHDLAYTAGEWHDLLPALAGVVGTVGAVLAAFSRRLTAEKRRRNLCEFDDITHGALCLLANQDGTPTPLAAEVGAAFDYIYVDEYQDVNEVQHRIFAAIARAGGRFMVGDVKQSIYSFRGAQPEIFVNLRRSLPPLSAADGESAATLSLSRNFRSAPPILDFVNLVYGGLMRAVGEGIGYQPEEDALVAGRTETGTPCRVTVAVFEKEKDGAAAKAPEETEEKEPEEDGWGEEVPDREARYVAAEIAALIGTRGADGKVIRPSDIAILVRKGGAGKRFAAALAARGIRADLPNREGFFVNPEVQLAISLLGVIDNPRRDVYLAGLLRSPLYGFSMDDLLRIRRAADADPDHRNATLYEALCLYTEKDPAFFRGVRFLSDLRRFRAMAEGQPVDRLIRRLYRETGLLSLYGGEGGKNAAAQQGNLMLLYHYARQFEGSSFRGLYNFLSYVEEAIARGGGFGADPHTVSEAADEVHIMTIHQSKGLEFPICFLSGAGTGINRQDQRGALLYDRTLGCGLKLRDESGFALIRNPVYYAVSRAIAARQSEEEMRVLYVALTRPRERLYVTATVSDREKLLAECARRSAFFGAAEAYACRSHIEMILSVTAGNDSFDLLLPEGEAPMVPPAVQETAAAAPAETTEELCDLLRARFSFVYPDRYLGDLPGKLSVSRLYPAVLDEGDGEIAATLAPEEEREATLPRFLGGEEDSAARAGTATHLFLQFCDFGLLLRDGAERELARLRDAGFLTAEDAARVRLPEIAAFARSPLLAAMTEGEKLYRELRFHVRLPAEHFTSDPARQAALTGKTVLVQGVMDAVLLRPDGQIWLIDYKTDRLPRDRAAAEAKLRARHTAQLSYYAAACREMFGRVPDRVLLYALALGDTVSLSVSLPPPPPEGAPFSGLG